MIKPIARMNVFSPLFLAMALWPIAGCSTQGPRHAVGIEGGGQRFISERHARMWKTEFTDEQWMHILRQRVHQPIAIWQGIRTGYVKASSSGIGWTGLDYRDSVSHVLESQLSRGLLAGRPLLFLPLFTDPDPEVVLTGVFAYWRQAREITNEADAVCVAEAIRTKLLGHRDVRVRWAAVRVLAEYRRLTVSDVEQGLNDETDVIRIATSHWLTSVVHEKGMQFLYDDEDRLAEGDAPGLDQMVRDFALLAPVLIEHLNDTHFQVRPRPSSALRHLFRRWRDEGNGSRSVIDSTQVPKNIDWIRTDWGLRQTTQQSWAKWWQEHGIEALFNAHPLAAFSRSGR